MPFDPSKPAAFREILKKIKLGDQAVIDLVHRDRKKSNINSPEFKLSRATLNRFKNDIDIGNINGLRELWRVLEKDENYGHLFPQPQAINTSPTPDEALAIALNRHFSEAPETFFKIDILRKKLAGKYTLYRPAWRRGVPSELFMTSLVEIEDKKSSTSISEIQNFTEKERYGEYYQKDAGFLFSYGRWGYFLTGGTGGNTSLKLGAINDIMPGDGTMPAKYFCGLLYTTGHQGFFPGVKFFCKRMTSTEAFESKHLKLTEIHDEDAHAYLSKPIVMPSDL